MRRLLLFLLVLLLTGCTAARPDDPAAVVMAMAAAGGAPTVGALYFADRRHPDAENTRYAMPEDLIAAAYGEEAFALLEAYAVRLGSFAAPGEVGCFVVARERDVEAVAAMCLQRMHAIRRLCGDGVALPPPLIRGRCVYYAVGEGAAAALDAARAAD